MLTMSKQGISTEMRKKSKKKEILELNSILTEMKSSWHELI